MATLGTTFIGAYLSMGGSSKADPNNPPINAKSKDEESFIKYVQTYRPERSAGGLTAV
jgi:F-type H+-transporting ATPase subunit k